jgi:ABC-type nitrate/sulfonate/bicarbonate transport system substrate-binding protein
VPALRLLYRDIDRLPYLYAVQRAARARGLDLSLVLHQQIGDKDWGEVLKRGEVDAIAENYWALVRYRAAGDPFVTVASAANWWDEILFVRPDVGRVDDLKQTKMAARSTGPQRWFPRVFLERNGLLDDVEIEVVPEREVGRMNYWQRVASGDCAACFVPPLYADGPRAAGLRELPYPRFAFNGGHVIPTTTEAFIARQPDAVQALVDAMFDACALLTASGDEVVAMVRLAANELRAHFTIENDADVVRLSAMLQAEISPVPIPTLDGLRNALDIICARFPDLRSFDPLIMWDLSFARAALGARS